MASAPVSAVKVELWTAFSPTTVGGSPAGVVRPDRPLSTAEMQQIARDVGAPATGFVFGVGGDHVTVRFFSTTTEYGMCGHGTIAVLTQLAEAGDIPCSATPGKITISTGSSGGSALVRCGSNGRIEVLLQLDPAPLADLSVSVEPILRALGTDASRLLAEPMLSSSDFTHLLLPMSLGDVGLLDPDFEALGLTTAAAGIDTVAAFSTDTSNASCDVHVRDFCPAVGTPEAAATGTTNRAVFSHLAALDPDRFGTGDHVVRVEQGLEMGRPSLVEVHATTRDGVIESVAVGGVATRLPDL